MAGRGRCPACVHPAERRARTSSRRSSIVQPRAIILDDELDLRQPSRRNAIRTRLRAHLQALSSRLPSISSRSAASPANASSGAPRSPCATPRAAAIGPRTRTRARRSPPRRPGPRAWAPALGPGPASWCSISVCMRMAGSRISSLCASLAVAQTIGLHSRTAARSQPVRQSPGLCTGAFHLRLLLSQQAIQLVDQRPYLAREVALESRRGAGHARESAPGRAVTAEKADRNLKAEAAISRPTE